MVGDKIDSTLRSTYEMNDSNSMAMAGSQRRTGLEAGAEEATLEIPGLRVVTLSGTR